MTGFEFSETMSGTYTRNGDGQARSFSFHVTARAHSLWRFLRDKRATLDGVVEAEGLAQGATIEDGAITIDPLIGRFIRYEFSFVADDGKRYRFAGQKDVKALAPLGSMTTLPGELRDPLGTVCGQATVRFHMRDLAPMLASFRPLF